MAWDYDDSALISLCSNCHKLVHLTISSLIYFNNGEKLILMNFTPCKRCGGAGWIPMFKHVQGGICFRCKGQRYEELISTYKNTNSIDSYLLSDDECFDCKCPEKNMEVNEKIYNQGRNCHLGLNGSSYDTKTAYIRYKESEINGHGKAQNNFVYLLKMGAPNVKKDYQSALRWFLYSAMQGVYQAQSNLSEMFENGLGVERNIKIANEWQNLYKINRAKDNNIELLRDLIHAAKNGSKEPIKALLGESLEEE